MSGGKPVEARAQRAQSIALTEKQAIRIAFRQIGRHLRGSVRSIKNLADLFQVGVGQHLGQPLENAVEDTIEVEIEVGEQLEQKLQPLLGVLALAFDFSEPVYFVL